MKGLILVGGYGTRLRPLTLSVPKPLIEFCNKPIVEYQIKALGAVGVKEVILAIAYNPDAIISALEETAASYGVKLSYSLEKEPLGTGGPLRLARDLILADDPTDDPFFVLNSDVICDFPMAEMIACHKAHGKEGTVLITEVSDPSKYGVVVHNEQTHRVDEFIEKPQTFVGKHINAGIYLLNKSVIDRIELRPTSIERETLPAMAADGNLFCHRLKGFWADIGQPKDFLQGTKLYLNSLALKGEGESSNLGAGPNFIGNVLIHPTAKIHPEAIVGPDVTIGAHCDIGAGVRIKNSTVLTQTKIDAHSFIDGSIIGWNCKVGKWTRIEGMAVLGEGVSVTEQCLINGAIILPHKGISENVREAGTILM